MNDIEIILKNFKEAKKLFNGENEQPNTVVGKLYWTNPSNVLWLWSTDNQEGYEGSQTQIGINKKGKFVWGYFSHCSCFGYEDYTGETNSFPPKDFKSYEFESIDKDINVILDHRLNLVAKVFI